MDGVLLWARLSGSAPWTTWSDPALHNRTETAESTGREVKDSKEGEKTPPRSPTGGRRRGTAVQTEWCNDTSVSVRSCINMAHI